MKKIYIVIGILLLSFDDAKAQGDHKDFPLNKIKINFAVPDLPAFKAMGTEPSNLLRPSTPEAFSAILPQFLINGQGVLPKSMALEFAPYYIAHQKDKLTLGEFLKSKTWESFRISIGTSSDSTKKEPGAIKLGLGLRFSIINNGDLKYDTGYLNKMGEIFADEADKRLKFFAEFNKINNVPFQSLNDASWVTKRDKYIDDKINEEKDTEKALEKLKEDYKQKNWNAEKLDIAFALVTRSPDQFTSNLKFNKFSTWITYARPCKDWGQLLVGGNYSNASAFSDKEKKDINFSDWSLSSRMYVGSNNFKGFIEAQYTYKGFDSSKNWFTYLGLETVVMNGIWLHLYGGYQAGDTVSQVVSNLDFRFTLPEK